MEAPSLHHFNLDQTFFGFKPEDRVKLHENIFNLIWYAAGRWSWDDIYNLPIFLRNYYVKRVNKMIEQENEFHEQQLQNQKAKQASSSVRNLRR